MTPGMSEPLPNLPRGTPSRPLPVIGGQGAPSQLDLVEATDAAGAGRPWLGVWYTCANKYVKVFRSPDGQSYTARCPKREHSVLRDPVLSTWARAESGTRGCAKSLQSWR
jgi:hypothetical protein